MKNKLLIIIVIIFTSTTSCSKEDGMEYNNALTGTGWIRYEQLSIDLMTFDAVYNIIFETNTEGKIHTTVTGNGMDEKNEYPFSYIMSSENQGTMYVEGFEDGSETSTPFSIIKNKLYYGGLKYNKQE